MDYLIHIEVLGAVFAVALVMGAVAAKTNFCTMGAVSDWVTMGETGRLRAWLLAMVVAVVGVLALEIAGLLTLPADTFPPYRTPSFAWSRYILGGLMFGAGMTLASGCGYRTLVRIGGGNLKSVVVLAIAGMSAYLMVWTDFYLRAFGWLAPATIDLTRFGIKEQSLPAIVGGALGIGSNGRALHLVVAVLLAGGLAAFIFSCRDFRHDRDNIFGGLAVGLAVTAGWFITGGPLGAAWKDWASFAEMPPSRVAVQSYTFISPMADLAHFLKSPNPWLIDFGIAALAGVILGSFLYALAARSFRVEWFASVQDLANHVFGALLMGIGGVLAMGCTIGQGVSGLSTLALGSCLAAASFIAGAAAVLRYRYWAIMRAA